MRNFAEKLFLVIALGLLASCGSSSSSGDSNPSPSPTATATPAPLPNGGSCPAHTLAIGDHVAYIGPRGSAPFTDASVAYTGVVKQINAHVLVTWDNAGIGDVAVNSTTIVPKIVCSPDLAGKGVEYIGQQTASTPSFNNPSKVYFGTVIATYSLGYIEVQWNDFSYHTVEPAANLSVNQ